MKATDTHNATTKRKNEIITGKNDVCMFFFLNNIFEICFLEYEVSSVKKSYSWPKSCDVKGKNENRKK